MIRFKAKANPRFAVTSLAADAREARALHEDLCRQRGERENRIEECRPDLFAESLARKPDELRRGTRDQDETDIMEWFEGARSVRVPEEIAGLGSHDRVPTVPTRPDLPDEGFGDEDEESDEAMEGRGTPRFRRRGSGAGFAASRCRPRKTYGGM